MILDTRTVVFVNFIYAVLMGLGFLFASKDYSGQVKLSMRTIGLALLGLSLGSIFIGLRGVIPDLVSIIFGNIIPLWSNVEMFHGLRLFDGMSFRPKPFLIAITIVMTAILFFYIVYDSLPIRTVLATGMAAVITGFCAWQLLHFRTLAATWIRIMAGTGFTILAGVYLFRCVYLIFDGVKMASVVDNSMVQLVVYGSTLVGLIAITFGYLLMCTSHFNAELRIQALIDPLSGLYNRRAVEEFAEMKIASALSEKESLVMLLIDVDHFKVINDTFGHAAGDDAIASIAAILRQVFRKSDLIARIGGDEFVALLPKVTQDIVGQVLERISSTFDSNPIVIGAETIQVSVSVGYTFLGEDTPDYKSMFALADQSLYQAKQNLKTA